MKCLNNNSDAFFYFPEACIDAETRKRYIVGETFIKEDKCCTCRFGGTDCKRVEFCRLGNSLTLLLSALLIAV